MCTWEEEQMAPLAIESTKDFVDRYIVVDKASEAMKRNDKNLGCGLWIH
jgi:hypothetical protein